MTLPKAGAEPNLPGIPGVSLHLLTGRQEHFPSLMRPLSYEAGAPREDVHLWEASEHSRRPEGMLLPRQEECLEHSPRQTHLGGLPKGAEA